MRKKENTVKTKRLNYNSFAAYTVFLARTVTGFFLVILCIFLFVACFDTVHGPSMYPTFVDQQDVLVWRMNYTPVQGDVVVIDISALRDNNKEIIKRVIATEGQTVDIDYNSNTIYVDGSALEEDYLNDDNGNPDYDVMIETTDMVYNHFTVPEGCIFVLGDNRNYSTDSRFEVTGFISVDDVIGKVMYAFSA